MGSSIFVSIKRGVFACQIFTLLLTSAAEREKRQLSCVHPLRDKYPEYFTHCSNACQYTSWSSWRKVHNSVVSVPVSQCPSEKAYTEERTRSAIGTGCTDELRQTQNICLPTQEERLILALGLGGNGNNYDALNQDSTHGQPNGPPAGPPGPPGPPSFPDSPGYILQQLKLSTLISSVSHRQCKQKEICNSLSGMGKRSISNNKLASHTTEVIHTDLNPIPFDWLEHGPRLRSKRQASTCGDEDIQHVLFVLDTSGSIGEAQFERIKQALSQLPLLFCKQVKFAAITFSTYINLEFCFDCFENTRDGRTEAEDAIKNIVYQDGGTHTGATAKCVCEELLRPQCGIKKFPDCLDVVFITDGKSNDPTLQICEEVRCLHNRLGVDTYAIGINSGPGFTQSYNRTELDCITNYGDLTSAFEFESFTAFETAIRDITLRLLTNPSSSENSCVKLSYDISPTGAVPAK